MVQVEPRTLAVVIGIALALVACAPDEPRSDSVTVTERAVPATPRAVDPARCYRSPHSILLGPPVGKRNVGHAPGWIRLDSLLTGPTGPAQLLDANSARLAGQWHRQGEDSLHIAAGDDFLRTELHVAITDDSIRGRATAHSDADLERDAAGRLVDVRRAWNLSAVRASCDSLPRGENPAD